MIAVVVDAVDDEEAGAVMEVEAEESGKLKNPAVLGLGSAEDASLTELPVDGAVKMDLVLVPVDCAEVAAAAENAPKVKPFDPMAPEVADTDG